MLNERLIYLSPLGFNLLESQHVADEYIDILKYQYMYCVIISFLLFQLTDHSLCSLQQTMAMIWQMLLK